MDRVETHWTLGEIAGRLKGRLEGPAEMVILRPAPADSDDPQAICFAAKPEFLKLAEASAVGAVLLSEDLLPCRKPHIVVPNPRTAFGELLELWRRPLPLNPGVHPLASVDPTAQIDATAQIGPYAVVERSAWIGPGARVYPFAYVGEGCRLGEGVVVYPHAVLYQDVCLGNQTIVHAGAVLGADGFGFEWDGERQVKVPQVGTVRIGDGVEIGANTAIDRAMSGETALANGVKIDNLVQIGHNSRIGEHTVIAAQTGISGSTQIGAQVVMGGACATSHHVRVADGAVLGGRTGVTSDIEKAGQYWGTPARPMREAIRSALLVSRLPELLRRLRRVEQQAGIGEADSE